ncbi:MAG: hypothetical protein MJ105_02880 [Lachnospiraceae bacterium]|nr:hypothetical protein [Lachnospiraceae bacterium]
MSALLNHGNTDMTVELSEPTLPTLSFVLEGMDYNLQYGYLTEMNPTMLRDCITPLEAGRKLSIKIDTYDQSVSKIRYQLRSQDGSRLIEDSVVYGYLEKDGVITADLQFQDLIEKGQEYSLCFLLDLGNGQTARYYSRIIEDASYNTAEKLRFAYDFTNTVYDRPKAYETLSTYMESNAKGDNSSFAYTNIHSSMKQLVWGNLQIHKATEPMAYIRDINDKEGTIALRYYVGVAQDEEDFYGYVNEKITMREGKERFYLMDYERTLEQSFDMESGVIANNKIVLGITGEDVDLEESEDGKYLAFVSGGKIFSYGVTDHRMTVIYDPYDREVEDARKSHRDYRIKLFSVEETGDVWYMIYGYQNRGKHEGKVGTAIYHYDGQLNTIEEMVYIPYSGSVSFLYEDVEELCYVNSQQMLHIKMDNAVYCLNLKTMVVETLVSDLPEDGFVANAKEGVAAWIEGDDLYDCDTIVLKNLKFGSTEYITAEQGSRLLPIGFFGNAFIYGMAKKADIGTTDTGKVFFPMYHLRILSPSGSVLKDYEERGILVTKVTLSGSMLSLERVERSENGFKEALPDQILNNVAPESQVNTIQTAVTDNYETLVQIALRKEIETKGMKMLYPRYVLFEGDREVLTSSEDTLSDSYLVYKQGEHILTTRNFVKAAELAREIGGTAQSGDGKYLYHGMERNDRNQIMFLKEDTLPSDQSLKNALPACVTAMCLKEGVRIDGASELGTGKEIPTILEENIPGCIPLSLEGADLEMALDYVQQDYPVLVNLKAGAVLLIGYNQTEVVLWDPVKGSVYKISRKEALQKFSEDGNPFTTYVRF